MKPVDTVCAAVEVFSVELRQHVESAITFTNGISAPDTVQLGKTFIAFLYLVGALGELKV